MTVQRRTFLGLLGDVGFPDYDGAVVYRQVGRVFVDYADHYDDGSGKAIVGTFEVPAAGQWRTEWWVDKLKDAVRSTGEDLREVEEELDRGDPLTTASVMYNTIKGYTGLDHEERIVRETELPRLFRWVETHRRRKRTR